MTDARPANDRAERRRRIGFFIYDTTSLMDVGGPVDVFEQANTELERLGRPRAYEIMLLSRAGGTVLCDTGFSVGPTIALADAPRDLDTLLVTGGKAEGIAAVAADREALAWLRRSAAGVRRTASFCNGVMVLAEAGLLNGRSAATHWRWIDRLAADFPEVSVERDAIYVRDGHIYTSAGSSACMDLALALVEEDLGREIALMCARSLVLFLKRPGGQSQFSCYLEAQAARTGRFDALTAWIVDNPAADLRVPALADRAGMSARNFARVFTEEVGMTPAKFVECVRVDCARRLLEDTEEPIARIAENCGFGTPETLRRAMDRRVKVGPEAYRRRFQAA
ncbi:MAG: DJ-1/PfpI family protein [Caulobacterales bacterium]|nr:DJ-1/PfpI family protein [Caulobacterales bacterium]